MSLLWRNAAIQAGTPHEGMAWNVMPGEEHHAQSAKSVRHAGFAGYVSDTPDYDGPDHDGPDEFDEDLYDAARPDPTSAQQAHEDYHEEPTQSFDDRHQKAYQDALDKKEQENEPDHADDALMKFVGNHGTNTAHWKQHATYGHVDLRQPVHATQSHVSQNHIDKYLGDPGAQSHHREKYPNAGGSDYLGDGAPMFVTHEGRLHATEGHHRTAAALQRGDSHIMGWHYDADKHGFPDSNGNMPDHPDYDEEDEEW
jgi:hypothetical protein